MSRQSEQILEEQLIGQLQKLGYSYIVINSEKDLLLNLKGQLEKHNNTALSKTGNEQFTQTEFERLLNLLSKGSVFEKSKMLRQKQHIVRDNGDNLYFEFLNTEHWCQNQYQVTNQVSQEGKFKNRYDVTILINGLPLVQIELKRTGIEIKEAFNQINRYQNHSFWSNHGLFQYVQLFVISNSVNTKYLANNALQSVLQTYFWADEKNKNDEEITDTFQNPKDLYLFLKEKYQFFLIV